MSFSVVARSSIEWPDLSREVAGFLAFGGRWDMEVDRRGERAGFGTGEQLGGAYVSVEYGRVKICFSDSRGFGESRYNVRLEPIDFADMMEAMLRANPEEAIKAFASALKDGVPAKREIWHPDRRNQPAAA
jgi:hypothetical protein